MSLLFYVTISLPTLWWRSEHHGRCAVLPWRNWLARSAVNRKVGGSSPPGSGSPILRWHSVLTRPLGHMQETCHVRCALALCNGDTKEIHTLACPQRLNYLVVVLCIVLQQVLIVHDQCLPYPQLAVYQIACRDQDSNLGYCGHNAMY